MVSPYWFIDVVWITLLTGSFKQTKSHVGATKQTIYNVPRGMAGVRAGVWDILLRVLAGVQLDTRTYPIRRVGVTGRLDIDKRNIRPRHLRRFLDIRS